MVAVAMSLEFDAAWPKFGRGVDAAFMSFHVHGRGIHIV